jgi:hypothetical protein
MKHEAIYNLYPNVTHIVEDNGLFTGLDINEKEVTIDMDAVNAKATELQTAYNNEQETLKTNKVSAYRKMEMTDDEILAIDPTLEEYL